MGWETSANQAHKAASERRFAVVVVEAAMVTTVRVGDDTVSPRAALKSMTTMYDSYPTRKEPLLGLK